MVYLDNAATTFPKSERVYQAMEEAGRRLGVNAGRGSYALAREAASLISDTREKLLQAAGASRPAEAVLTASATLAFNAIIGGIDWNREDVVYVSPYEHNAVIRTLAGYRKKYGFTIRELPVFRESLEIDSDKTAYLFAKQPPTYLFLNMVSNVTGYILPVEKLCALTKQYKGMVVLDGAQALGSVPVDLRNTDADFLVFAGHKALGGPFGIGGYLNLGQHRLRHVFYGGTGSNSLDAEMPEGIEGYEPGSPDIVAVAGLHAALEEISDPVLRQENRIKEQKKTGFLVSQLSQIPGLTLYSAPHTEKQAGILSVNLEGYRAGEVGKLLDEDFDIAVRTGYHCAPLIHSYLGDEMFGGTVRISIGRFSTEEEMQKICDALWELSGA